VANLIVDAQRYADTGAGDDDGAKETKRRAAYRLVAAVGGDHGVSLALIREYAGRAHWFTTLPATSRTPQLDGGNSERCHS